MTATRSRPMISTVDPASPGRRALLAGVGFAIAGGALRTAAAEGGPALSDAEWRARLTPEQYAVLRTSATEAAFSSPLDEERRSGRYDCAGCGAALFRSSDKFDSGTGWPSFTRPLPRAVVETDDRSLRRTRTAVSCRSCGGHLGHVFRDGPPPTGLRYCMNGVAMAFRPAEGVAS